MKTDYHFVIDKTPRYWEILDEIVELFPKSKIIILKRNPKDVFKSIVTTWDIKTLNNLTVFKRDLLIAPKVIKEFCKKQKNNPNVYEIKYELLIKNLKSEVEKLYNWIGLQYDDSVLDISKNKKYKGKFGDPYQNTKQEYTTIKKKLDKKMLTHLFRDFLLGYNYYFGKSFFTEYGYHLNVDEFKSTFSFKYFLHLGESKNRKKSFKREVIWRLKKYFYQLRIPR